MPGLRAFVLAVVAAAVLAAPALAASPTLDARAYVIENGATGEVLGAHAAGQQLPMASITKLMTVLLTLEHAKLNAKVTIGAGTQVGGSSIYLRQGETLTVRELVEAALIQSANDSAVALADYVGHGNRARFVAMMNARARRLGLRSTHFVRPDGLDAPGHVSTARDLTTLGRVLMRKPFVRHVVAMHDATIAGGRHLATWNDLLGTFPGVIGVKTGHTGNAGWCQVAAVRGQGVTLYATILGSPSRAQRNADLETLLRWGLSRYRLTTVIRPHRTYASADAPYDRGPVKLVATKSVKRAVRLGRRLREVVVAPAVVPVPVTRGVQYGTVKIYDRDRLIASSPLVAAKSVSAPGIPSKAGWYAKRVASTIGGWLH
jgi:D-alanyl-D-alanine carboxypeptidase (penicillin-binding protein 5/6)